MATRESWLARTGTEREGDVTPGVKVTGEMKGDSITVSTIEMPKQN